MAYGLQNNPESKTQVHTVWEYRCIAQQGKSDRTIKIKQAKVGEHTKGEQNTRPLKKTSFDLPMLYVTQRIVTLIWLLEVGSMN